MAVKVFASSDLISSFTCPECGKSKQMDVSKFMRHKTEVKLKYKCPCKHEFSVILERRRAVRKNVQLQGHIIRDNKKFQITIKDISKNGLKIELLERIPVTLSEKLRISFSLDDPNQSKINKDVIIKNIRPPKNIGVEFTSNEHYDNFGKYLLFHFG